MQVEHDPQVVHPAPLDEPVDGGESIGPQLSVLGEHDPRVDRQPYVVHALSGDAREVGVGDEPLPEASPEPGRPLVADQVHEQRLDLAR